MVDNKWNTLSADYGVALPVQPHQVSSLATHGQEYPDLVLSILQLFNVLNKIIFIFIEEKNQNRKILAVYGSNESSTAPLKDFNSCISHDTGKEK